MQLSKTQSNQWSLITDFFNLFLELLKMMFDNVDSDTHKS